MTIHDPTLGRIEVFTIPLPDGFCDINGTYTPSGRVLVSVRTFPDADHYSLFTLNDDGEDLRRIF